MSTRRLALTAALALATVAACGPPQVGETDDTQMDTGTLRIWMFEEPNNAAKDEVVREIIAEFEADHDDVEVDLQYITGETRAERMTGAFNDPSSAPDVVEYGNTDMAYYVGVNGLADLTEALEGWEEGADLDPRIVEATEIDGSRYGLPYYTGVRALYYRTDLFDELGLDVPETLDEVVETAEEIRDEWPDLYGLSVGGRYTYAMTPMIWANGGALATESGDGFEAAINTPEALEGIEMYADLISDDNCPPSQCAQSTGGQVVEAFAAGQAGMVIAGDFNRTLMDQSEVADDYAVVPLPGIEPGSIAPVFAGGNNLGVMETSQLKELATDLMLRLGGKDGQRAMFEAMGNLSTFTDVQAEITAEDPFLEPFVATIDAGTEFVPSSPAWATIDAQAILPTMVQRIVTGEASVEQAADDAVRQMDELFAAE